MPPPVQSLGRACPPSIFFHRRHRLPAHAPARVNHAPPSPSPPHASRSRLPRRPSSLASRDAASPRRPPPQLTALAGRPRDAAPPRHSALGVPARGPAAPASSSQPPGYRGPEGGVCAPPPPPRDPWGSISGLGFGRRRPLAAAAAAPSGLLLPASRLSRPGRRGLRSPSHAANYGEFHAQEPQPERDNAEEQDDASEGQVLLLLPAFELITLILPNPIAVTSDKIIARRRCIGTCADR